MEAAARKVLDAAGKQSVTFHLRDEANILRLYLKYLLVKLWIEQGYTTSSLVPYKKALNKRLQASSSDIDTLNNFFVSREQELEQLNLFLENPVQQLAIVKGEARNGKRNRVRPKPRCPLLIYLKNMVTIF